MSHDYRRDVAPTLFAIAIGGNYALHKAGWPTLCHGTLRPVLHTERVSGKIAVVGIAGSVFGWLVPHLILPQNQYHIKE